MTALPTPISVLADTLQDLVTVADTLRKEIRRLEAADARGELSEVLRRGRFPLNPPGSLRDEQERLLKERHCDPATKAIGLTRSLREQARHVIHALPAASTWTDDRTKPAQERWTVEVADEVRGLASCPYRGQPDDAYMSDLPWPDQGISEAIGGFVNRLGRRLDQVLAIGRVMADPIEVHNHALPGDLGVLDAMEARALLQLGEREFWGVDELPEGIDADMLRCLDDRGLVEARYVVMQNRSKHRGDTTPPAPVPSSWFSPMASRSLAGGWDKIVACRERNRGHHPNEVRLSERGRSTMARYVRRASAGRGIDQQPLRGLTAPTTATEEAKPKKRWTKKEAAQKARKYLRHHAYPGLRPLADLLGCPASTLSEAITADAELAEKRREYAKGRAPANPSVRAGSGGSAIQSAASEQAPARLTEERADEVLDRLVEEWEPSQREAVRDIIKENRGNLHQLVSTAIEKDDKDALAAAQQAITDLIGESVRERSRTSGPRNVS
ncbi:MAG: hypothetical protein KJZ54_13955 [Phycisphaerales bacterium]|nr:hypothetical protein [Phycisphaerales bacterium]